MFGDCEHTELRSSLDLQIFAQRLGDEILGDFFLFATPPREDSNTQLYHSVGCLRRDAGGPPVMKSKADGCFVCFLFICRTLFKHQMVDLRKTPLLAIFSIAMIVCRVGGTNVQVKTGHILAPVSYRLCL